MTSVTGITAPTTGTADASAALQPAGTWAGREDQTACTAARSPAHQLILGHCRKVESK